jgi:hypothetical protein
MTKCHLEIAGRNQEEIELLGADEARYEFLYRCFCFLAQKFYPEKAGQFDGSEDAFLNIPNINNLWHLFKEIFKNIHDHNGGWGYMDLEIKENGLVSFTIGNLTNPTPETNEHQPETKANFGIGLDLATKGMGFSLDIDAGYVYKGTYQIPSPES